MLTYDTAYIVEEVDGTRNDIKIICDFNFKCFLRKEDIFLGYSAHE